MAGSGFVSVKATGHNAATIATTINAGESLVLMVCDTQHQSATLSVSDTLGNTYTSRGVANDTFNGATVGIFDCLAPAFTGSTTITVASSLGASTVMAGVCAHYTGLSSFSSGSFVHAFAQTPTTVTTSAITPSSYWSTVVCFTHAATASTPSPGSGFTQQGSTFTNLSNGDVAAMEDVVVKTGTQTGSWTFGAGSSSAMVQAVAYVQTQSFSNKVEILLRNTAAYVSDPADGAHLINNGTTQDLPPYSGTGSQQLSANNNTFNIGWVATSNGANIGSSVISANDNSASGDARVAGSHRPLAATGSSLKVQAGNAPGTFSCWLGISPETNLNNPPGTLTIRDSNGTLATVTGTTNLQKGNVYGADGTFYSTSAAWAAASGGAGVSIVFTTTDTSNGLGGPFLYFDCGTSGSTTVPLSYIGLQLQTGIDNLTGQSSTFTLGAASLTPSYGLTNQTVTSSVGTITPAITTALTQQTITSVEGLIFNFEFVPQTITSTEGIITAAVAANVTLALSGQTAQFLGGSMGGGVGYILDSNSIILVGQSAAFSEGIIGPRAVYQLTAQSITSAEGTISEGLSFTFSSQAITSFEGQIVANTGNNFNNSLHAQSVLSSMGAVTGTLSYTPTAETITSVLGSLTFSNTGNFTVQLVGETLNSFIGVIVVSFPGGMPNITGQLLDDALLILQQVGVLKPQALGYFGTYPISVDWIASSAPPSTVLAQSISPGSTFTVNMPITLTCSEFPISVAFP